ncbi:tyrosine-type recombinase/integrase [Acetobacter persici]|uniref:tyrosine-type recombinase/integrase n=1 Tax=Acetobacter persici TaxID=1076596 RepID=UPI0039ED0C71
MDLTKAIGHYRATEAGAAWVEWGLTRGKHLSRTTKATWRARYCAAINYGSEVRGISIPQIAPIKRDTRISTAYLSKEDQEKLIAAYADYARPIAITLCFQGIRSGEAIRLDWRYVDFERRSIFIHRSKNGQQRSVPMHPRVFSALHTLWMERGQPKEGTVFLNYFGKPFANRAEGSGGGNPLLRPHNVACKAAGIKDFTPHSWRHHWASWMVMSGCDLFTLMRLGGWSNLSMVQRYAAVSSDHMKEAILRLS